MNGDDDFPEPTRHEPPMPNKAVDESGVHVPEHDVPTDEWRARHLDARQIIEAWNDLVRTARRPSQDAAGQALIRMAKARVLYWGNATAFARDDGDEHLWKSYWLIYSGLCRVAHVRPDEGLKP